MQRVEAELGIHGPGQVRVEPGEQLARLSHQLGVARRAQPLGELGGRTADVAGTVVESVHTGDYR